MRSRRLLACLTIVPVVSTASPQVTWTIDPKPITDIIGSAGGVINFGLPAGATRLSDGTLLIADRGGMSIQVFDPAGKLVKSVGRSGEGPGEFQTMIWAGGCGADSLLVWDPRLGRGTFVGKGGVIARQFTVKSERPVPRGFLFSCGTDGTISYLSEPSGRRTSPLPNVMAMLANVVTLGRDGTVQTNYGQFNGGEWYSPGRGGFPRPLGATAGIAMVGRSLVIGTGDSASVLVIAPDGKRTTVAIPGESRAPTREEFDAAVQAIGSMAPAPVRQSAIEGLSKAPVPPFLPPYAALFSDPAGLLWVQLSPSGAKQVDLVAYSDDADEMHVAVYRLKR